MAIEVINIETFLQLRQQLPVFDVRSPGEFEHAHIPNAISLPLFTNEERAIVGTQYKQVGKQPAIKTALPFFAEKMVPMIETVEKVITKNKLPNEIIVHCWRGGMRSAGVAWLLNLYGFKVYTLQGGYKAFRNWALQQFEKNYRLNIIGGYTGSGKTGILKVLQQQGHNVIDLEALAHHKGSAFGGIDMPAQPSQEMFENSLALQLYQHTTLVNNASPIWLEDESQRIGTVNIPIKLFEQMRQSPVYFFDIPFEERLKHIMEGYGKAPKEKLISAIMRIKKRLCGLATKNAINFLLEEDVSNCFSELLIYYDKLYWKGLPNRNNVLELVKTIPALNTNAQNNAQLLQEYLNSTEHD
jgi:tRNA 2-selenouridine synthase